MKPNLLLSVAVLLTMSVCAVAAPEDMEVNTWGGPGCEHSMVTNWFELDPGESVEFELNLSGCTSEHSGSFFYFGNISRKNSSPQLSSSSKILLDCSDGNGMEESATDGSIYTTLDQESFSGVMTLGATNMNRSKTIRIRLRSESGL